MLPNIGSQKQPQAFTTYIVQYPQSTHSYNRPSFSKTYLAGTASVTGKWPLLTTSPNNLTKALVMLPLFELHVSLRTKNELLNTDVTHKQINCQKSRSIALNMTAIQKAETQNRRQYKEHMQTVIHVRTTSLSNTFDGHEQSQCITHTNHSSSSALIHCHTVPHRNRHQCLSRRTQDQKSSHPYAQRTPSEQSSKLAHPTSSI
jgi:hypothetical protein